VRPAIGNDPAKRVGDRRERLVLTAGHPRQRAVRIGHRIEQPTVGPARGPDDPHLLFHRGRHDHLRLQHPFELVGQPEPDAAE
jgi:hypothetical protein